MLFRVSSGERSASPRRALFVATLLFGAACALAASMSWRRSPDTLGENVKPTGWNVSFSPPKGFLLTNQTSNRSGFEFRFVGETVDGHPLVFIFRGATPDKGIRGPIDTGTEDFGDSAMSSRAFSFGSVSRLPKSSRTRVGPLPGAEVPNLDGGIVVRAAVSTGGVRYAVVLISARQPIGLRLYELFDSVCASVRFIPD